MKILTIQQDFSFEDIMNLLSKLWLEDKLFYTEIETKNIGHKFQLTISDNGPDPIFPKKIFLPYYTTKKSGSGLGLFICKKYCEVLGFEITFSTLPKKQFIITEK